MAAQQEGVDLSMVTTAKRANILSLFTSGSTLICCALPATLVAIGSAATLTSLVSTFPQLIWISEHKTLVFSLAAVMLILAGYLQWQARNAPCPADPELAEVCTKTRKSALLIYYVSVAIFMLGAFFAFVAPLFI
ncbi:MAG: hypothetical protein COB34_08665 [Methylophilaceae bacterium]|nr:MAG: hypothetical protein COB34_08665 [Methylophilaceae bacterium]